MKMKQINLANRKEYIEQLKKEIEHQEHVIKMIESYEPTNLDQEIILEYAIQGAVKAVTDKLNSDGHRFEGRKYLTNDISDVIRKKPVGELHEITKKAFEHNSKGFRY
ncbi:hypothetical protein [Paenibacillus eucommiae]|uniref:Uncharacterized protein n=1 Tax=Paenibacillus eucommiae TaxID=1355755 RepID=A0ABS4INR3_9BACL|nr:hypothetical protein [Paenibacillus eucommiae]MBP1989193.1 hypothetical protein [Paenibacillus eucommiae]